MAYAPGYLSVLSQGGSPIQLTMWSLVGTDAGTAVDAAAYVTDAGDYGVKLGDLVFYTRVNSLTAITTISEGRWFQVTAMSAAGAATLTEIAQTALS